jgi:hypothetical protein
MDLMPMHRITMQARRATKIEEDRQKFVQNMISTIYTNAVQTADTTDATCHKHALIYGNKENDFTRNAAEITDRLRALFPNCNVTYTSYVYSYNNWYEESTITEAMKPFLTQNRQETIVIDWA